MLALGELLDDLGAEGGQVIGLTAGHQPLVGDYLLVDPGVACIADIASRGSEQDCDLAARSVWLAMTDPFARWCLEQRI
jgi:hypothetical protein